MFCLESCSIKYKLQNNLNTNIVRSNSTQEHHSDFQIDLLKHKYLQNTKEIRILLPSYAILVRI